MFVIDCKCIKVKWIFEPYFNFY